MLTLQEEQFQEFIWCFAQHLIFPMNKPASIGLQYDWLFNRLGALLLKSK